MAQSDRNFPAVLTTSCFPSASHQKLSRAESKGSSSLPTMLPLPMNDEYSPRM